MGRLSDYTYLQILSGLVILLVVWENLSCHGYVYNEKDLRLASVPTNIPENATSVILTNNRITNLTSGVFSHLRHCTSLELSHNYVLVIESGAFSGLSLLTNLNLGSNRISQPIDSSMWKGLQFLEILLLRENYIHTISPEAFSGLIWLKTLKHGHNYLSSISPSMWVGLRFLEWLSLNDNQFTDIPHKGLSHMPELKTLYLSNNQLRTMRIDTFDGTPNKLQLYLYDNPIHCDTTLCWMKEAKESGSIIFVQPSPKCANLDDAAWQYIDLNCSLGEHYTFFISAIGNFSLFKWIRTHLKRKTMNYYRPE